MKLSIIVPVHNEAENIRPQVEEIFSVLGDRADAEVIYIDDGSTDNTRQKLRDEQARWGERLRILAHDTVRGQSAAIHSGVRAARSHWIATLDGDGQNDPSDIPRLLDEARRAGTSRVMVIGHRIDRRDTWIRRASSRIANAVRGALLRDGTPDSGCGLKIFPRELFLALPCFDHMHRFLSALVLREGGQIKSVPVAHRPRRHGRSKYGLRNRLWVGIIDLIGVAWLQRRVSRNDHVTEVINDEL